jgi:putative oxidoreductase
MDLALLVLRLVVGLFFVGHGAQKLWGTFGGHGLAGTAQFFETSGMRPGRMNALAAGWAELLGGLLIALGLFTPLGTALIVAVMAVAILTVHAPNGPWVTNNGWEYNAVLMASVFALAGVGAGSWSLDAALNWDVSSTWWALGALAVGLLGAIGAVIAGRTRPAPAATPAASAAATVEREARVSRTEVATPVRTSTNSDT